MTPPSLQDIFEQSFGTPNDIGEETPDSPVLTPVDRTSRITLGELQNWINSISSSDPNIQGLKDRIISFNLDGDITIDSYQSQIEMLFGAIQAIPEEELSTNYILVLRYLESVESLYQNYLREIGATERDSEIRREGILPAELSDGRGQFEIWRSSIQNLFEGTEHMNENQLIGAIESISLTRSISLEEINNHFDLLLTNTKNDQEHAIAQGFIDEYKRDSQFYRDLERGTNFSLDSIGDRLDGLAREIIDAEDGSPFVITLESDQWQFETKREALLMIYQLKLHLDEMEPYMIPYFFDQYGLYFASGLGTIAGLLLTIGGPYLIYSYAKNMLQDHMGRINEGLTRDDITRLTNNGNTGVLDETIRGFEADGFSREEIKNLHNLSGFLTAEQTPQTGYAEVQMLRTNSDAYRQFARSRGRIGYLISSIYRMNSPLGQHRTNGEIIKENPFTPRNIIGLIVGSYNKGPDGFSFQTQRQVFERYIERFREFNEMIGRVDEILIAHGKSDEKRLQVRKEIRNLFIRNLTIPLLYPQRVFPFRNRSGDIMRVLERNGVDTSGTESRTLERRLRGQIESTIGSRITHIRNIIHYHPSITDYDERRIIRRLDWMQHDETLERFNQDLNGMLGELGIDGMTNESELRRLNISEDLRLSGNDLNALRSEIPTRTPNRTNIERYLAGTTEGHKGLIFLNIARIIRGENILTRITLEQADIIAEPMRHTPIQRFGGVMETDEFRNIVLPEGGAPAEPERAAATEEPRTAEEPERAAATEEPERAAATEPERVGAPETLEGRINEIKAFIDTNNLSNLIRPSDIRDEATLNSALDRIERILARDYFDRILMTLEIQGRTGDANRLTQDSRSHIEGLLDTGRNTNFIIESLTLHSAEAGAIQINEIYTWERIGTAPAAPHIEERMNTFNYSGIRRGDVDLREITTRISFGESLHQAIRRLRR